MTDPPAMPQLSVTQVLAYSSDGTVRHIVMQGENEVSSDPHRVLTTVLGSCIACCLYDPVVLIGGMNHFLLAEPPASMSELGDDDAGRYGLYSMELLVNAMLARGATRKTMRAHLYGGANLHPGMRPIGTENSLFATQFLRANGIMLVHADTGGSLARRLDFQPASGRIRCRVVDGGDLPPQSPVLPPVIGDAELF